MVCYNANNKFDSRVCSEISGIYMVADVITDLSGQFLAAVPSMDDPRFARSVIYICSHSADGAMGLVINRPKDGLLISDMLEGIGVEGQIRIADTPVLSGGPVDIDRGFVLHTADYYSPSYSLRLSETLCLTSTKDVLEALMTEEAPELAVLIVGYSGWNSGQLEAEIRENVWMVVSAKESLIFDTQNEDKWESALATLNITPETLSLSGGSA